MEREHDTTANWGKPAAPEPALEREPSEADTPLMTDGQPVVAAEPSTSATAGEQATWVAGDGRARADDVPTTGDPTIDAVLAELAEARDQPLEAHIAAGEKAHRVLQARLSDLAGE